MKPCLSQMLPQNAAPSAALMCTMTQQPDAVPGSAMHDWELALDC